MKTSIRDLIQEATAYQADAFDRDEDINGGDLVEWFADWRRRAMEVLTPEPLPTPRRDVQGEGFRTHMIDALRALQHMQDRLTLGIGYHAPGYSEMDELINAISNGGARITVGAFVVMVFRQPMKPLAERLH